MPSHVIFIINFTMKKTLIITVLFLTVMACHRKMVPATNTTIPTTTTSSSSETTKTDELHVAMVEQGKTVYINRCGRCHALKNVEKYTIERWDGILKSMIPKARLNESEAQQVTAYVKENAGK